SESRRLWREEYPASGARTGVSKDCNAHARFEGGRPAFRRPALSFLPSRLPAFWGSVRRLRQELERINQLTVGEDFVVKVRSGCPARRADEADDVAALDPGAGLHVVAAQMTVAGHETETVLDDNEVAVIAGVRRGFDRAVGRRVHRLTLLGRDVEALMK